MKYCNKCGNKVNDTDKFCKRCGNKLLPLTNSNNISSVKQDNNNFTAENIEEKHPNNISNNNIEQNSSVNTNQSDNNNSLNNQENPEEVPINANKNSQNSDTNETNDSNNINNNNNTNNNIKNDFSDNNNNSYVIPAPNTDIIKYNSSSRNTKKIAAVILSIAAVALIVFGVFHKFIFAEYYCMKANNALSEAEKIEYSSKAVESYASSKTKSLAKKTFSQTSDKNLALAETKLKEMSSILSQKDYRDILNSLEEKKIENSCNQSKYSDALIELGKLYKLGGDIKSNKNYDTIMLNVVSELAGTEVKTNKHLLLNDGQAYYGNLDDDPFDEIIEVNSDTDEHKINLFKFNNNKYELTDTKIINTSGNMSIKGIYKYTKDKNGVYIEYEDSGLTQNSMCVLSVSDNKLIIKGTVSGQEYVKVDDIDNDKIYEICSSSISDASSVSKTLIKWYKINDDGSDPKEIKSTTKNSSSSPTTGESSNKANLNTDNSDSYIFPNSDCEYLSDEDLKYLSKDELALARNEIFARHGYVFTQEPFKSYFAKKNWYSEDSTYTGNEETLNDYEKANCKLIQSWEKK